MTSRKNLILLVPLFLVLFAAGCPRGGDNPESNPRTQTPMPREIGQMESALLEIMQQADLVPLVERSSPQEGQEAEQAPTFEETTLGEVLNREAEAENGEGTQAPPETTEEIWDDIKMRITELHGRWDDLEPALMQEKVSENVISAFEEELDSLTVAGTAQNPSGTLTAANQLTLHLAKFRVPFAESAEPLAYELRYHVRNIVLNAAGGDFAEAQTSLAYIKEQQPALTKDIEEEDAAELDNSLDNLQRALDKEDLDLVKINAAEVMENLARITGRLE